MTLEELKQLRDQLNTRRQDAVEAEGRANELRNSKTQLEAYIARLAQELNRTNDPIRRQMLIMQLAGLRQRLAQMNAQLATAEADLVAAETQLRQAEASYESRLAALIPAMDAGVPLALLPVRIETRFIPNSGGFELRVRVYPDDIQVNAHKPELTGDEAKLGQSFHTAAAGGQEAKRQAWAELAGRLGPQRAAWVVRQTGPQATGVPHDRDNSWTLGERATVLPDLWYFIGFASTPREERLFLEHGDLIPDSLPLWYDPHADSQDDADLGVAWLTDFEEAKKVGMAHSIQLTTDQANRLARLVVVGTKATVDAVQSGKLFEELLDAHHYTWGLGFVPQGTPTNNTTEARSGFQERDPRLNTSFAIELQSFTLAQGPKAPQDGLLAAQALGFSTPSQGGQAQDFVFAHVQGADGNDQVDAAHINHALWPATWGYFLKHMMYPVFNAAPLDDWQQYFTRYVRGRGPLPALRTGNQPYGLLPVTSLDSYLPKGGAPDLILYTATRNQDAVRGDITIGWDAKADWSRVTDWEQRQTLPNVARRRVFANHLALTNLTGGTQRDLLVTQVFENPTAPGQRRIGVRIGADLDELGNAANWGQEVVSGAPAASGGTLATGVCSSRLPQGRGTNLTLVEVTNSQILIYHSRPLRTSGAIDGWLAPTILANDLPGPTSLVDVYVSSSGIQALDTSITLLAWVKLPGGLQLYQKRIRFRPAVGAPGVEALHPVGLAGSEDIITGPPKRVLQTIVRARGQDSALLVLLEETDSAGNVYGRVAVGRGYDFNGNVDAWTALEPRIRLTGQIEAASLAVAPLGWRQRPSFFDGEEGFIGVLLTLRKIWQKGLANVPHIDRGTGQNGSVDVDRNLIETLAQTPATSQVGGRQLLGPDYMRNLLWYQTGLKHSEYADWEANFWRLLQEHTIDRNGGTQAKLGLRRESVLARAIYAAAHFPFQGPLVTPEPLSETETLEPNYIAWLLRARLSEIHGAAEPDTLLFRVLRVAVLQAFADTALALTNRPNDAIPPRYREPELVDMADFRDPDLTDRRNVPNTFTAWRYLKNARLAGGLVSPQSSGIPVEEFIRTELRKDASLTPEPINKLRDFLTSLTYLSTLPTARLHRLFSECLDLSSHRLDAWITSFATYRLQLMRAAKPTGLTLGGYGWVEWKGSPVAPTQQSTGYIQAPSLAHAATAAVLRSGYLSHNADASGELLALDLSSRRVRTATWLMEGIRRGQPLGALLGYRFERMLAERSKQGVNLQQYIDEFRAEAPLVAHKMSNGNGQDGAVEAMAAQNVVDGLALLLKKRDGLLPNFAIPSVEKTALAEVLEELDDALDSVSDLVVAESVYQAVLGNPMRAGGGLTAIASGEAPPPEAEVVRSARSGVGVTNRLLAAFNSPLNTNDPVLRKWAEQPRGQAEPRLNAWAAHLFGDPEKIVFWATFLGPDAKPLDPPAKHNLKALGLCPLDLLFAQPLGERTQRSELEQRLLYWLPLATGLPDGAVPELAFEDPRHPQSALQPGERALLAVMEVARAARDVISSARALAPGDLSWPERAQDIIETGEIEGRLTQAHSLLSQRLDELKALFPLDAATHLPILSTLAGQTVHDGDATSLLDLKLSIDWRQVARALGIPSASRLENIRAAILALAAFGLDGTVPVSKTGGAPEDGEALFLQARLTAAQAQTRLDESENATLSAVERIEALFGGGFRALSVFRPGVELKNASDQRARIGDAGPDAVLRWLQQIAQVRPAATRLEALLMYAAAAEPAAMDQMQAAQLPVPTAMQNDTWIALPQRPFPGGRMLMVICEPLGLDPNQPVAGLMLDEWVEVVPNEEETTAVTFHYDAPGARPPQSILLAVPAQEGQQWTLDALEKTLLETLELAKLRTVDLHSLPEMGHFLPASFLAFNHGDPDPAHNPGHDPNGDTISTNFVFNNTGRAIWHP